MKEGSIRTVVVVGAGIMGRGIALASARAGFKTSVIEPNSAVIESARGEIDKILDRAREKNEIDEAGARARESDPLTLRALVALGGIVGAASAIPILFIRDLPVPTATAVGGGIYMSGVGSLTLNNSTLNVNKGTAGGGIYLGPPGVSRRF